MTHTVTLVYETRDGARHIQFVDLACTSTATASGEDLVAATDFGMGSIYLITNAPLTSNGRYAPVFDNTTQRMRYFLPGQSGGLVTEVFPDVKGAVFASITSDAAAAALNDANVMALTDATVTTAGGLAHAAGKSTGLTNPASINAEVAARSVVIVQNQNGAGGTWTAGFARVTGTDAQGAALVEDIALQTTAIADTKFRLTVGTKAFATVTNVVLLNAAKTAAQAAPASGRLSVGVGTIFGLRGVITAESDIKAVRKDNAAIAAATYVGTVSQVDLGADVADNVDLVVEYLAYATEAPAATNVGTVRCRVEGF